MSIHSTEIMSSFRYNEKHGCVYRRLTFLGFPNYRVGWDGSVWTRKVRGSWTKVGPWWRLTPGITRQGYQYVNLFNGDGVSHRYIIHHLVLFAFDGPLSERMECRHFPDPCKSNNNLENLQWGTRRQNTLDREVQGVVVRVAPKGSDHYKARLTEEDILQIRKWHKDGVYSTIQLAKMYGVVYRHMYNIIKGLVWKHI